MYKAFKENKEIDMGKNLKKILGLMLIALLFISTTYAGNKQRVAQSGASEMLLNPWGRSTGLGEANVANIRGLEGIFGNVAGTAHLRSTQLMFTNTQHLTLGGFSGATFTQNTFGVAQKVGDAGVLSLAVDMINYGDIEVTKVELPEPTGEYVTLGFTTIGVSFAKEFSNSIYGGITAKVVNLNSPNMKGTGVAFDAGIQYITGKREQIKFGVTMKNVGPTMEIDGDGLSLSANYSEGPVMTMQIRPEAYELPSLIKLGASYDFYVGEDHGLVVMAAFTENSFTKSQFHGGLEYDFKGMFFVRGGYIYEDGITDDLERSTAYTGISAGFSLELPFKKGGEQKFGVDYSYRDTDPFDGTHTIGVRISL